MLDLISKGEKKMEKIGNFYYSDNETELEKVIRELAFDSKTDTEMAIGRKYESLSPIKKEYIQKITTKLIGHDYFGFNLKSVNEFFCAKETISQRRWGKLLAEILNDDQSETYRSALRNLEKAEKPQEGSELIIETYCDCLMISSDLLCIGEGEIFDFDTEELEKVYYKDFIEKSKIKKLKNPIDLLTEYEKYLEKKHDKSIKKAEETLIPPFKDYFKNLLSEHLDHKIIKGEKYIKNAKSGVYILLQERQDSNRTYKNIKDYIDYLIMDLIDKIDIDESDIDKLDRHR